MYVVCWCVCEVSYLQKVFNVAKLLQGVVDVLQGGCVLAKLTFHLGDEHFDVPDLLANALLLLEGLKVTGCGRQRTVVSSAHV